MTINLDSQIISNRPENVYYFSGMPNLQAAYDYADEHTNHDYQIGCVMTPNEDGEGVRCDENTIWYIITAQNLPLEFFTKASLTPEGEEILQRAIEEDNAPLPIPPVANT